MGANCDQCDIGYYGDGTTSCTSCGTHKTTPDGGTAATESECECEINSMAS